tara:strand:- start:758 stop:1516 length:759 start_codon:yes stop_codon:yes gene_type:complete
MASKKLEKNLNLLRKIKLQGIDEIIGNSVKNRLKSNISDGQANLSQKDNYSNELNNISLFPDLKAVESLDDLKDYMSKFKGCELYKSATNMVFSDGNKSSQVMLIGEAPGHDEDIQGKPFVGRSGKLLNKMLEAIGLSRETVYIANIVPWRPPNNRRPTEEEINICLPFIRKHIELISPKVLMLLGSTATYALLRNKEGITKIRGKWVNMEFGKLKVPTLPSFHPAFLLRQPAQKKYSWEDLKMLKKKIDES